MDFNKLEIDKLNKLIKEKKKELTYLKKNFDKEFNDTRFEYLVQLYNKGKKDLLQLEKELQKKKLLQHKSLLENKKQLSSLRESFYNFYRLNKDPLIKRSLNEIDKNIKKIEKILK